MYTNEDLKWDAPGVRHFKSLLVSDPEEWNCPIFILRWFKYRIINFICRRLTKLLGSHRFGPERVNYQCLVDINGIKIIV